MKIRLLLILTLLTFYSCFSKKENNLINEIRKTYNAENVSLTKNFGIGSTEYEITLENPQVNEGVTLKNISASCAYYIHKKIIDKKNRAPEDLITINIIDSDRNYYRSFSHEVMKKVDTSIMLSEKLFKATEDLDYERFIGHLDTSYFKVDSNLQKMFQNFIVANDIIKSRGTGILIQEIELGSYEKIKSDICEIELCFEDKTKQYIRVKLKLAIIVKDWLIGGIVLDTYD